MDDKSYFLRKEAEITAIWQGLKLAQRSMYKIQTRTKPPNTSISEKDCEITMAAQGQAWNKELEGQVSDLLAVEV